MCYCRLGSQGDLEACRRLLVRARRAGASNRVTSKLMLEASMQAWWNRGRPQALLQEAMHQLEQGKRLGLYHYHPQLSAHDSQFSG